MFKDYYSVCFLAVSVLRLYDLRPHTRPTNETPHLADVMGGIVRAGPAGSGPKIDFEFEHHAFRSLGQGEDSETPHQHWPENPRHHVEPELVLLSLAWTPLNRFGAPPQL